MSTIRATHYDETEQRLTNDPIVQDLAAGVAKTPRDELAWPEGTPRHDFMGAANAEYRQRGGTDGGHIGAIAHAILALLDEDPQIHVFGTEDEPMRTVGKFRRYEVRPGVRMTTGSGDTARTWIIESVEERATPEGTRTVAIRPA